jgi:peptidoglycan hydrolase CwlO-like protein
VNIATYIALAAILVAPLIGYLTATRRLSGKIGTSDAQELWSESRSIRDDYRTQITRANARTEQLEARVDALERLNAELSSKNAGLNRQVNFYESHVKELQARIDAQEAEIERLTNLLATQARTTLDALNPETPSDA